MTRWPDVVFDVPWLLALAVVLPSLVWIGRRARFRERAQRLQQFARPDVLTRLVPLTSSPRDARRWRLMSAVALITVALAGPRWGLTSGPQVAQGIDMVIAMDASLSMLAPDEHPTRLERMKQEVRRLRAQGHADRVALIAFAARSYVLTPLTTDEGAIDLFLDNLDPSVVGQAGSAISTAIEQGTELLKESAGGADRAIVLLSDGESFDTPEDITAAAKVAGDARIRVITVGFGSEEGSTIPIRDGNGVHDKRDQAGAVVITRYHPEMLEAAAKAAGGLFIPAELTDKATRIRGALRSLRAASRPVVARDDHIPRFLWCLVPALLLLMVDTWPHAVRRRAHVGRTKVSDDLSSSIPVVLLAMLVLPLGCRRPPDPALLAADGDLTRAIVEYRARIDAGDTTRTTQYNLATTLLQADSLALAAEALDAVRRATDGDLRARARFNAGLAHLQGGRAAGVENAASELAAARAAYRVLLQDRPGDRDAQWNYELALRRQPPTASGKGQAPPPPPTQTSSSQLDQRQAEALLNSAARDEKDVQNRRPRPGKQPPQGKDW